MKELRSSAETRYPAHISHGPPGDKQNYTSPAPVVNSGSEIVLRQKSRKITRDDIALVQNLIERCLQLYMTREEVVDTLMNQARIDPGITNLIWQKLEEENADFFKAYFIRLKVKRQITMFNKLLEEQYRLMGSQGPPRVPLASAQKEIHHIPVDNLPMRYQMLDQQPLMASKSHPQIHSVDSMANYHMTNGIHAPGNFPPVTMNLGKDMMMGTNIADTNPAIPVNNIRINSIPNNNIPVNNIPANNIKSERNLDQLMASCGQYSFESAVISDMGVNATAIDSSFLSPLEVTPVVPYNGVADPHFPQNHSRGDAGELGDFSVEQFLNFPCSDLQTEEDSHGLMGESPKRFGS